MSKTISKPVSSFRSATCRSSEKLEVTKAGRYGNGAIEDFAVITAGVEALGHGVWIDEVFVEQVSEALKASPRGTVSRFTHPGMSSDAFGKGLGRVVWSEFEGGILRGDLHFYKSASKSPDGDLAAYIKELADEDPESFGASIVFFYDSEAEAEFVEQHSTNGQFQSPDPNNVDNFPHVRLAELKFVDIVDQPAANPGGLFHQDSTFNQAEEYGEYVLGLSDEKPEGDFFGADAERLRGFVTRFLTVRELKVMKVNFAEGEVDDKPQDEAIEASEAVEATEAVDGVEAIEASEDAEAPETVEASEEAQPETFQMGELDRYIETFGVEAGVDYFRNGVDFHEAQAKELSKAKTELDRLRAEQAASANAESQRLSANPSQDSARKGLSSRIKVNG